MASGHMTSADAGLKQHTNRIPSDVTSVFLKSLLPITGLGESIVEEFNDFGKDDDGNSQLPESTCLFYRFELREITCRDYSFIIEYDSYQSHIPADAGSLDVVRRRSLSHRITVATRQIHSPKCLFPHSSTRNSVLGSTERD